MWCLQFVRFNLSSQEIIDIQQIDLGTDEFPQRFGLIEDREGALEKAKAIMAKRERKQVKGILEGAFLVWKEPLN